MQEYQVTVGGVRYALDRPLFVLATQNPIEQEGTYPLPEAQLDRFMFNVVIDYPTAEEERRILSMTTGTAEPRIAAGRAAATRSSGCTPSFATCRRPTTSSTTPPVSCARRGRPPTKAPEFVRKWVRWGAGPRAGQALLLGAKARALLDGRTVVAFEDITRRRAAGAAPSRARELPGRS